MQPLILSLHRLRKKRISAYDGFTMLEVLVSIMVSIAFVMGTLQAMVVNAIFQVRAEREAQATFWIQQDMERVKAIAELPPFNSLNTASEVNGVLECSAAGTEAFVTGFGGMLRDELYDGRFSAANNASPKTLTLPYGVNSSSFAVNLTDQTANVQVAEEKNLVNKPYRLVRLIEGVKASDINAGIHEAALTPHVLRIQYRVGEKDDTQADTDGDKLKDNDGKGFKKILAQVYTEVMPSGALDCTN